MRSNRLHLWFCMSSHHEVSLIHFFVDLISVSGKMNEQIAHDLSHKCVPMLVLDGLDWVASFALINTKVYVALFAWDKVYK